MNHARKSPKQFSFGSTTPFSTLAVSNGCRAPGSRSESVDRVEIGVKRTEVDGGVGAYRRRRLKTGACGEFPLLAAVGVDCVEIAVGRADVDGAVGTHRRRGLNKRGGGELPLLAAVGVERVEIVVVRADVDGAVGGHRRRGVNIGGGGDT